MRTPCQWIGICWLCIFSFAARGSVAREVEPPNSPGKESEEIRVEFRDESWLAVLQWLADRSALNLDWKQLPEDKVNLSAQEPYTLETLRDVLNMQLLARGFTLLQRGNILRVVSLKELDPTLVPRVEPEELEEQLPHQFVRVSFRLEWLVAQEAAEELAPLLSPFGKLIPLSATNRLEAMDAVVNLRELHKLLNREQSQQGRQRLVAEFPIEHRRAIDVAEKVRELLGLDSSSGRRRDRGDRMRLDIERTRLQSQAVEKLGKDARKLIKDDEEVHLVVNEEKNSILINAPPDKVELARQAIQALDQPHDRTEQAWQNISRVKVYELQDADLDAIEEMLGALQELGNLDPDTRIEVDERSNRAIVYALPADHLTIAHLVRSFEKERRQAEVVPLHVLEPRYAAKAVETLFSDPNSDEDSRRRWRSRGNDEVAFRVQADVAHNRLLLWATRTEIDRVHQFLFKLGEKQIGQAESGPRFHVVEANGANLMAIEDQLRALWENVTDVPLIVEAQPEDSNKPKGDATRNPRTRSSRTEPPNRKSSSSDREARNEPSADVRKAFFAVHRVSRPLDQQDSDGIDPAPQRPADESAEAGRQAGDATGEETADQPAGAAAAAPVKVVEGPGGKLYISSEDPASAGLMKQILGGLLPEQENLHVFYLKHASALSVQYQLRELLDVQQASAGEAVDVLGYTPAPNASVYANARTNSLLVRNATAEQLRLIENLIETLDVPEEVDPELARQQRIYRARYKKASELAETVKEIYQDLLSASDKAFAGRGDREANGTFGYWGFADARSKVPTYQGLLSVGVEETSNSVVVSAPGYLMAEVMDLMKQLDSERSASTIAVVPLNGGVSALAVQQKLANVLNGNVTSTPIPAPKNGNTANENERAPENRRRDQSERER